MRPPNPAYGSGAFRRKLHLSVRALEVAIDLEDSNHGFRLRLAHDGVTVTGVRAEPVRHPFVTCPEAVVPLRRVLGARLDAEAAELRARLVPGEQCTHLFDMAMLAHSYAGDAGLERLYEVVVDDEREGVTRARVECDGASVHDWQIRARALVAPAALAGRPMMRGFYAWASERFAGMELEAAVVLQRGYFVAQSRRMRNTPAVEFPATADDMPEGNCHSYNAAAVGRALRIEGAVRDLTHRAEALLQFEPMKVV